MQSHTPLPSPPTHAWSIEDTGIGELGTQCKAGPQGKL